MRTVDRSEARSGARPGSLPAEMTSFVGRRREIAEVRQLLSTARLVTLTGVGGAGKTRLAVRVAAELRRAFPDGVWLVDLAPVPDAALMEYAVAEVLGVRDETDRPIGEAVVDHLREGRRLLVLDNCEHLLDACARFAGAALRAAPDLRILCTSRQPLGLMGEHVWNVPPLPMPPDGARPAAAGTTGDPAAVELFADRAAVVVPGFALGPDNQPLVLEICRRLDGLPLAIELAAGQLRVLSVRQLATAVHDRFGLLVARYASPAHHRTLAETFDWSFALCSPPERALWQQMSVFAGGFELAAVEYVCAADDGAESVLGTVAGLIDKSVLSREEAAGQVRYRLLETVRQYGLQRLRSCNGEELALRRRHLDWYRELARSFDGDWFGPDQLRWATRMRHEMANLRAALAFSLTTPGEEAGALEMATDLFFSWYGGGLLHEGRYWLDRALAANTGPTVTRLKALETYSRIAAGLGDLAGAEATGQECLDIGTRLGSPSYVARGKGSVGMAALLGNDLPRARPLLEESHARLAARGEFDVGVAIVQISLAMTRLYQGDVERAADICADARAACKERGERWWLGYALSSSAVVALALDDAATAEEYLRESLRIRHPLGDLLGMAGSVERLAWTAAATGNPERAAVLLGAAHELWRAIGRILYGARQWLRGHEDCVDRTRAVLGDAAYERAFRRGTELSLDEAVAFALEAEPARPDPSPDAPPLTPRERQVAELVAQGMSNKQLAAHLVVSRRTAESHVENILRKLGLSSRTQLAAWMSRQGT